MNNLIKKNIASLRIQVVDALRHMILYGDFLPGEKLIERDLCERLEVSRTLIREALQHIESEGLIVNIMHKGFYVVTLSKKEMKNIYQVRRVLEELACRLFATNASAKQIENLCQRTSELEKLIGNNNKQELLDAKNAFYKVLCEGADNPEVTDMLRKINNRVTQIRRISLGMDNRFVKTVAELSQIVAMLKIGNGDEAARLCGIHLDRAEKAALSQFNNKI